ncbi:Putative carboxypeptidase YodJ [Microbacterium sp. Bi98]|uniref:M15 family metallopeptidase n=1 Tax=unclassified Microbacterium TaxID=2609290 RepID=UPI0006F1E2E8|nr:MULTISPECIES: M15 family metallopeptidase [unclassified Microbacterium]KRD54690.1 peptidase M15 [Microbacterium sp. Root280D1]CAH0204917.1 Putative carboxypeptidase YodJ [Microbacterium sp. Bi98]
MFFPPQPQHAAPRSPIRGPALPIGLAATAIGVLLSLAGAPVAETTDELAMPQPSVVQEVPAVEVGATTAADPCSEPSVLEAIAVADDAAIIAGFGGGESFRSAVVAGNAPCIALDDPAHVWVVVNKARPLAPVSFAPSALADLPLQMTTRSGQARTDVAAAVGEMADAAAAEGAGRIGANNGYRSYELQVVTHASHVRNSGQAGADASSARAGHSEHQTGLALDLVACDSSCGAIESFGATVQGQWIAANAWEYGFIVRYEQVGSGITGYKPEPWHLRYLGRELAAAYHHGGYHTLEEFFGLPAAPDYAH